MSIRGTGIVGGLLAIVTTVVIAVPGYGVAQVEAQGREIGPVMPRPRIFLRRWVAIAHARDYRQTGFLHGHDWERWQTFVSIHGINGTDRVAQVGTYVIGDGQLFATSFRQLPPGLNDHLLHDFHFGGTPGGTTEVPPPYVGEVLLVVSTEPLIVTGQVMRGFNDQVEMAGTPFNRLRMNAAMSRTLDVRQYNCADPDESWKVAQFCRYSSTSIAIP